MSVAPSSSPVPASAEAKRRIGCLSLRWLCLFVIAGACYAFWPRTADIRSFDPAAVARLEARAWRHYYEKDYLRLGVDLYALCRGQLGASPARSLQIGWHAAQAARLFQRSGSREEATLALPHLRGYYAAVARASGEVFPIEEAALLELEWWQQRREKIPPQDYAKVIAECSAVFYGTDNADMGMAALLRAQAMAYRDARRNGQMQEVDWQHVEDQLRRAGTHLLAGVNGQ